MQPLKAEHPGYVDDRTYKRVLEKVMADISQPMPQNKRMEEAVLGAILISSDVISDLKPFLKPEHFYDEKYRIIYQCIVEMHDKSGKIDLLTVTDYMRTKKVVAPRQAKGRKQKIRALEAIGGPYELVEVTNRVAGYHHAVEHAKIIVKKFLAREGIEQCFQTIKQLFDDRGGDKVYEIRNDHSGIMRVWDDKSLLMTKTTNEWILKAQDDPDLDNMVGSLFQKGQVCYLFGESGTGKSIFAVQIGEGIARGTNILDDILVNECDPMVVSYIDFELSDKQFANRYTRSDDIDEFYVFGDKFLRTRINDEFVDYDKDMDSIIIAEIEQTIIREKTDVIILDNLTYICGDTQDSSLAIKVMKKIKRLKKKYNVSFLIIAHTPKRNKTMEITNDDMSGSKNLINFCDSAFAIGSDAQDERIKYIKQTKFRDSEQTYNRDNVITCYIEKDLDHMTKFRFAKFGQEKNHLVQIFEDDVEERLIQDALEQRAMGWSWQEIAKNASFRWSKDTFRRKVNKYREDNTFGDDEE
ncbi:MAG: DnaB-like helicase N-terminal domain-containing protein [Bacteroidota bacterium]